MKKKRIFGLAGLATVVLLLVQAFIIRLVTTVQRKMVT